MIFIKAKPGKAGTGMMGKGMGMVMGTKTPIGIRTWSTHTCLPTGYTHTHDQHYGHSD